MTRRHKLVNESSEKVGDKYFHNYDFGLRYKDCAKVRTFCAKFFQLLCSWWAVKSFFEGESAFKIVSNPDAIELANGETILATGMPNPSDNPPTSVTTIGR